MYSPKIDESLVKELYLHKTKSENKRPMTYYVNLAIQEYLIRESVQEFKAELKLAVKVPRQTTNKK